MKDRERVGAWRAVVALSARMGDELWELIERGKLADAARALA
jgi:hypothetical protein